MKEHLTLEEVEQAFANWRQTRTKRSKIPDQLIQQVVQLKKYPRTKITKTLKLNYGTLKGIINNSKKIEFISVPAMPNPQPISTITCTLTRGDGILLSIALTNTQLSDFLRIFLCCK